MSRKILEKKISLKKLSLFRDFENMAVENLKRIYDQDQDKAVQLLCKRVKRIFGGTNYPGDKQGSLFK